MAIYKYWTIAISTVPARIRKERGEGPPMKRLRTEDEDTFVDAPFMWRRFGKLETAMMKLWMLRDNVICYRSSSASYFSVVKHTCKGGK